MQLFCTKLCCRVKPPSRALRLIMSLEEVKKILNEKVENKYSDEEAMAIYAIIQQLVQIDLRRKNS